MARPATKYVAEIQMTENEINKTAQIMNSSIGKVDYSSSEDEEED